MPPIQWVTMGIAIFILVTALLRLRLNPEKRFIRYTVISLMIHIIIFYIFIMLKDYDIFMFPGETLDFSYWSSIVRFHSLVTLGLLEGYGFWRDKWNQVR